MQYTWHANKKPYFFYLPQNTSVLQMFHALKLLQKKQNKTKQKTLEMTGCSQAVF